MRTHFQIYLQPHHLPVSKTRHLGHPPGNINRLSICSYGEGQGYYLFHYTEGKEEELIDTYHETIEEAKEQASWEYDIQDEEWILVEER